ncbi:hypothetical protein GCM10010187_75190 [Actinomadura coerulea]|nr:hypothetical protein GCM10010187_75190 [Actinomadura coerulea]
MRGLIRATRRKSTLGADGIWVDEHAGAQLVEFAALVEQRGDECFQGGLSRAAAARAGSLRKRTK